MTPSIAQNNSVTFLKSKANFSIGSFIRFVPFVKDTKLKGLQQHHFDSYTAGSDIKMYQEIVPKDQQYVIIIWGFNDRYTCVIRFFKMKDWPCIYDEALQPKPVFMVF